MGVATGTGYLVARRHPIGPRLARARSAAARRNLKMRMMQTDVRPPRDGGPIHEIVFEDGPAKLNRLLSHTVPAGRSRPQ
jgi:hypothetical protein